MIFTLAVWAAGLLAGVVVLAGVIVAAVMLAELAYELTRRPAGAHAAGGPGLWLPRTLTAEPDTTPIVDPVGTEIDSWNLGDWPLYEQMKEAGELDPDASGHTDRVFGDHRWIDFRYDPLA